VKITASEVNRLRQATGAGMMDCKKALVEAEGDFEKAVETFVKKDKKLLLIGRIETLLRERCLLK